MLFSFAPGFYEAPTVTSLPSARKHHPGELRDNTTLHLEVPGALWCSPAGRPQSRNLKKFLDLQRKDSQKIFKSNEVDCLLWSSQQKGGICTNSSCSVPLQVGPVGSRLSVGKVLSTWRADPQCLVGPHPLPLLVWIRFFSYRHTEPRTHVLS